MTSKLTPLTKLAILGYSLIPLSMIGYSVYTHTGTKRPSPFVGSPQVITEGVSSRPINPDDYVYPEPSYVAAPEQVVTAQVAKTKPKNVKHAQHEQTGGVSQVVSHISEQEQRTPERETPPSGHEDINIVDPSPIPEPEAPPEPSPILEPVLPVDPPISLPDSNPPGVPT